MKDWEIYKDSTKKWWANVYSPSNGRCEGVAGPFRSSKLAKIAAKGMWYRLTQYGDPMAGLR